MQSHPRYNLLRGSPPLDPRRLGPGVDIERLKKLPPLPYRNPFTGELIPHSAPSTFNNNRPYIESEREAPTRKRSPSPFLWGTPEQHVGDFEYNHFEMKRSSSELEALKKREERREERKLEQARLECARRQERFRRYLKQQHIRPPSNSRGALVLASEEKRRKRLYHGDSENQHGKPSTMESQYSNH